MQDAALPKKDTLLKAGIYKKGLNMKYHRLKELRVDHDLTQKELAEKLFCQRNVYRRYESGEREIPVEFVVKLAQYYHVSADYLLGLTDVKMPYPPTKKRDGITNTLTQKNEDKADYVRSAIARNGNTSAVILESLSKDEAPVVRCAVALNENTPTFVLETLAKDDNQNVRITVTRNENTPMNVLETLAKDEDWEVRRAVARNENTPTAALETLSKDYNQNVRWYANKSLGRQPCISTSDLQEAKAEKDVRDAAAPKQEQKKQKVQEHGLE